MHDITQMEQIDLLSRANAYVMRLEVVKIPKVDVLEQEATALLTCIPCVAKAIDTTGNISRQTAPALLPFQFTEVFE